MTNNVSEDDVRALFRSLTTASSDPESSQTEMGHNSPIKDDFVTAMEEKKRLEKSADADSGDSHGRVFLIRPGDDVVNVLLVAVKGGYTKEVH